MGRDVGTPCRRPEGGGGGDSDGNGVFDTESATSEAATTSAATPTTSGAEGGETGRFTGVSQQAATAAPQPKETTLQVWPPDEGVHAPGGTAAEPSAARGVGCGRRTDHLNDI